MSRSKLNRFVNWEGLLLVLLIVIVSYNAAKIPFYLSPQNQVNLFELSIEKIIVALTMTFVIINGEMDLSVASIMGLAACTVAYFWDKKVPMELCLLAGMIAGLLCGLFNGFMVSRVGLPSLIVSLAGLIGYRGLGRVLIEERSIGNFPDWFNNMGQQPAIGIIPLSLIIFFLLLVIAVVVLQYTAFGRQVYVIGNNLDVARYSGVNVKRVKLILFVASGVISALAGILFTARLGAVRGDTAIGFELDVITMVLMGGVSIFGGTGSLFGVLLSILIILNLRNGMGLANISGNTQTGVIGLLLIFSVLVPNIGREVKNAWNRWQYQRPQVGKENLKGGKSPEKV